MTHFTGEPSFYDAMLWQAKTCIQNEEYERAASFLAQLQNVATHDKISSAIVQEIPLAYAWLYQKDGNEGLTIKYLNEALKVKSEKESEVKDTFYSRSILFKSRRLSRKQHNHLKMSLKTIHPLRWLFRHK